jgi:hypothetical protein
MKVNKNKNLIIAQNQNSNWDLFNYTMKQF